MAGKEPCQAVYADDRVLAFLAPAAINPGHTILVPRRHVGGVTGLPPEELAHLMTLAPLLATTLCRALDYDAFNIHMANGKVAGQMTEHAHIHLVPRLGTDGFHWNWRVLPEDPSRLLADLAASVRSQIPKTPAIHELLARNGVEQTDLPG